MTSTEEKSDLEKIVNAILKEISSIAKGKENEKSDYDIAVIVKEYPEEDMDIIARIRYSLLGKLKRPLELLLIGMDDLEYSSPFLYEIYHASRLLYGTDILLRCENVVKNIRPIIAEASGALNLRSSASCTPLCIDTYARRHTWMRPPEARLWAPLSAVRFY